MNHLGVHLDSHDQNRVEAWLALAIETIALGRQQQKRLAEHARCAELGESEALLLWTCGRNTGGSGSMSQRLLATRLGLSTGQVSGLLEGLRQRGLLTSRRSDTDRRRQAWSITDAGRHALAAVRASIATDPDTQPASQLAPRKSGEAA